MKMLSMCLIVCQVFSVALGEKCESEHCKFFDFKLLEVACKNDDLSNVAVAPLNVKVALMSLLEGYSGKTRDEVLSSLKFPSKVDDIREEAITALNTFQDLESSIVNEMTTCLWFSKDIETTASYTDALENYYNSSCEIIDFNNSTSSAEVINEWIRVATNNHIQSIVKPTQLHENANIVMTTALHFKGDWRYGFYEDTHWRGCYTFADQGCQAIHVMHNRFEHNYAMIKSLDAEVVELPYAANDEKMSMLLFRPQETGIHSLKDLIKKLSQTTIAEILGSLEKTEIDLVIPMFHVEAENDLVPILKNMGVKNLFGKKANMSEMLQDSLAGVDSMFYSVKVETHEIGEIEGDAYYMLAFDDLDDTFKYVDFDRPFVFAIIDRPSRRVLFAGRIIHPEYNPSRSVEEYDDSHGYMGSPYVWPFSDEY